MRKILKFFNSIRYDLLLGFGPLTGAAVGGWMFRNHSVSTQVIFVAIGGTFFLIGAILIGRAIRPRYTIRSNKFWSVFREKLHSDVLRFTDSQSSMEDAYSRIVRDSQNAMNAAQLDDTFSGDVVALERILSWFKLTNINDVSFTELMDRRPSKAVIKSLVSRINNQLQGQELLINSSIIEPGCVALVEMMRHHGLSVKHEFDDINGIEQARTLSSERVFAASFIPFATIFLSGKGNQIIDRYGFACPITSEDQQILANRNLSGNFNLEQIVFPKRGSGHFQQLVMKAAGTLGPKQGMPIDLLSFKSGATDAARILYEPIASIALEAEKESGKHGFATGVPYPVDIILLLNYEILGPAAICFRQLVIYLMWTMKTKLLENGRISPNIYRRQDVRRSFELANDYFTEILTK